MRRTYFVGTILAIGALLASTLVAAPTRRTTTVRFLKTTIVAGAFVQGTVVFEHDDEKMSRGEPCTTVYRFKSTDELGEPIVSFMCVPRERPYATKFEATIVQGISWPDRLLEYQIAGETEGHGVPDSQ